LQNRASIKSFLRLFAVGNVPHLRDFYTITGLWPGTQYAVKIVATNSAGSTTSEYTMFTQAALGGNLSIAHNPICILS
jgi:hypothetical protein